MARRISFRGLDGKEVRVVVDRVGGVHPSKSKPKTVSVIYYRSGIVKTVVGNYLEVRGRIILNKNAEIAKAKAALKDHIHETTEEGTKHLRRYLESKGAL